MFSNAVLADLIDCKEELRRELEKELYNYVSDCFSRGDNSIDDLTIDSGELNSFEVIDTISFEEEESEEGISVTGLISIEMTVDCFKYSNNENLSIGDLSLKGQANFSFRAIPDKTKNPYGSEFVDIEFFDIKLDYNPY